MLFAPVARAQQAQPPQPEGPKAEAVTRPRPLQALEAPYPEGAKGEATVVVTIVVNADGTVRSATAEGAQRVFADAAESAARAWRFEPATRDGKKVPAKVRAKILFRPPVEAPAETALTPATSATAAQQPGSPSSPPAARPEAAPIVVTVWGEQPPPHATTLSRTEVRLMPGAFGDAFRAIEALPGVTPIASGVPFFYVRGAPPGNVGYFIDDIRVPLLYHVALGPSVIHPELVDRVDLYRGGYPASFGRFAGGIVSGETRPPSDEVRAHASIRLVDAGALLEVPFAGGRGHALASGRYSYTAAVLSLLAPEVSLAYWDYQSRLSYRLTPNDEVSAFVFGSYDYLGEERADGVRTLFSTQFHRADIRYDHRVGSRLHLRTAVTLGTDVSELENKNYVIGRSLRGRSELVYRIDKGLELQLGSDVGVNYYKIDIPNQDQDVRSLFPGRYDSFAGAHAGLVFRVAPEVELTPGVRVDLYGSAGAAALSLEPRIAGRFFVGKRVRILHAYGFASQPPAFIVPVPGLEVGALRGGLQRSFQASAGVEVDLPEDMQATATVFRNLFWNSSDTLSVIQPDEDDPQDALDARSTGTAYGLEIFLRRSFSRDLGGYISYTLSRSTRELGEDTFVSAFDRAHVFSGALTYDFGRGYRAGARVVFYTGNPSRGESSPEAYDPITGEVIATGTPVKAPDRLPPFFRLDVRLEKRWHIGKTGWLAVVLEGLNATATKETFAVNCDVNGCTPEEIGPVTIPSLGVEGGF
jgi:TonB family protein